MIGQLFERCFEHVKRILVAVGVTQQLRFSQHHLHALLIVARDHCLQIGARFFNLALARKGLCDAALRGEVVIATRDLTEPLARCRIALLLFADLREIEQHQIAVTRFQRECLLEVGFGRRVILGVEREQAERIEHVGVVGRSGFDAFEFDQRLGVFLFRNQRARQRNARFGGSGIALHKRRQLTRCLRSRALAQMLGCD